MRPAAILSPKNLLRAALFCAVQFAAANLSLYLSDSDSWFVNFWLPGGIFIAVLTLGPLDAWPALFIGGALGDFAFDHSHGTPLAVTLVCELANVAEAAACAWTLRRFLAPVHPFTRFREYFAFLVFCSILGPALGASIGAWASFLGGQSGGYALSWVEWWKSDAMSILVITPLLLSWFSGPRPKWPNRARVLEMAALAAAVTGSTWYILVERGGAISSNTILLLPFILWAALRFGIRGVSATILFLSILMTYLTAHGLTGLSAAVVGSGSYRGMLNAYVIVSSIVGLTSAFAITERDHVLRRLWDSEERLRSFVENANVGIYRLTPTGEFLLANPAMLRILGVASFADLAALGSRAGSGIGDHPREEFRLKIDREGEVSGWETRVLRPDGSAVFIRESATAVRDAAGAILHYDGIAEDVSQRRRAEQALRESQERYRMLEDQVHQMQKMEALGTLAGGISHDFNNILAGILGNLELALMDLPAGHRAFGALTSAQKAALRARELVARILTFSNPLQDSKTADSLAPTVTEAIGLLRAGVPPGIEIESDIDPDCPPVDFDPGQIHQLIMNLGTNSAHALGDGGGRIHFGLHRVEPGRAWRDRHPQVTAAHTVCLTVRDGGCGMRPEVLDRIFEPFFTTKPFGEGTGLGLAIVHSIMKGHDGAVVVESAEGAGTAFHLYFPGAKVALVPPGCDQGPIARPPAPFGGGRVVLLVDDEPQVLAVMEGLVGRMGFAVESHTRPEEALAAFRREPGRFSIAITDLTMPRISGMDIAREILAVRPGFPIILSSGHVGERSSDQALALGIRCVIRKPFDAGFLAEQLCALI